MLMFFNKVHTMLLGILFLLSCLHLIASDDHPASSRKRPVHDPVSNFFSELGDLFLDVDRTLAVQTAPKVELEDNLVTQIFKPTSEYFDRIQKNYRNMQKRLGRLIGNTIGHKNRYSDHELSTLSPPHVLAEKQILTTPIPDILKRNYNPFAAADKERERLSKGFIGRQGDIPDADESYSTESSTGIDECSNEVLSDPVLEHIRQEKCNRAAVEQAKKDVKEAILDPKRASQILFPLQSKEFDKLSRDILGRIGDIVSAEQMESNSDTSDECSNEILTDPVLELIRQEKCHNAAAGQAERDVESLLNRKNAAHILFPEQTKAYEELSKEFLKRYGYALPDFPKDLLKRQGDLLDSEPSDSQNGIGSSYSESLFDKHLRQILTDHSRWLLENPLLNRWRSSSTTEPPKDVYPTEVTDSTTENVPEESTEAYTPTSEYKIVFSELGESPTESRYYKVVNDNGKVEEEVDIVLKPRVVVDEIEEVVEEEQELKDTVILAFTSDGVPLKLRMGPEIENPLRYLHKALKSAGVSLNVPVKSHDDVEPAGKEVLKLGSGLLSRAVYIDVSNRNELKTLLKTLMKFKAAEKL